MSARFLAWYTCALLWVASLLSLCVSVAPGSESRFATLQAILGGAALCFTVVGIVLTRLSPEHWCNRSGGMRWFLAGAALLSSMLIAMSVG
jgi:hypothetical protein